jgi:hypothetical protein
MHRVISSDVAVTAASRRAALGMTSLPHFYDHYFHDDFGAERQSVAAGMAILLPLGSTASSAKSAIPINR